MVLESVQDLVRMPGPKVGETNLAQDYFDALILRLCQGTDDWYRNHFPVIMETNMSHYFTDKIYNEVNQDERTFPTLEFGASTSHRGTM